MWVSAGFVEAVHWNRYVIFLYQHTLRIDILLSVCVCGVGTRVVEWVGNVYAIIATTDN